MGFIGGYLTLISGINIQNATGTYSAICDEDKTDVYYVIDHIRFKSDMSTDDSVTVTIIFNNYPSFDDRQSRINLIGESEYTKSITRKEFIGNILEDYYIYCKPLIIENLKYILMLKLGIDYTDAIPPEYSDYYTLTDHL
jgi:hypothetical protein